jgi:nitrogen-specific signal transduction histidine kinase
MLLTFVAMALALAGGIEQLRVAYLVKSSALRQARAEAHLAELARWAELAGEQERAHEARNALLGIQAAMLRLEHLCVEVGAEDMTALAGAVDREISRLRQLVEGTPVRATSEFCRVDDALVPVLMCHAASDPIR